MENKELKTKSIVVYDRGQFIHIARRLGKDFGKVYYYLAEEKPYPEMQINQIGRGFEEFEVVENFHRAVDKADMVLFCDVYNGGEDVNLFEKGKPVFSALKSEQFETDRKKLRKLLEKAGLYVPDGVFIKGLAKAQEYLKDKTNKFIKTSFFRGDMETYHYKNAFLASSWFRFKIAKLGSSADEIEVLIEDAIESECETGFDTFMVDGDFSEGSFIGYEAKNKGYASCFVSNLPKVFQRIHRKMKPAFKHFGYRGWYSTEMRIDKRGRAFYMDATTRFPSPPSELYVAQDADFSLNVWRVAHGETPIIKPTAKFGAELVLHSEFGEHYMVPVQFPKEIDEWVALKNVQKTEDGYHCIPNDNDGNIGCVYAIADTLEEAIRLCVERAKQIEGEEIVYREDCFEDILKSIKNGERFGIKFGVNGVKSDLKMILGTTVSESEPVSLVRSFTLKRNEDGSISGTVMGG